MTHTAQIDSELRRYALDHVISAVESAKLYDKPFPHITVQEFFPQDVYAQLRDCLPSPADYEPFSYQKHAGNAGQINRRRFRLESAFLDRLTDTQGEFWRTIRSVLGSQALKETVFGKLSSGLSFRFNCDPEKSRSLPGFALPELFHETESYQIKPHPDTRKKVVTMQIALAKDESQEHLGTEFYRRSVRPSAWLRDPKGFEIVKTMPFLPNTTYAFVVLNNVRMKSWHGRSALPATCGVRDSLLNIWYGNPENANKEIIEENQILGRIDRAA